jgi:hypothetical protein
VRVVTRTAHASQVSDAVLDACLEQDPYAKAITHLFFKMPRSLQGVLPRLLGRALSSRKYFYDGAGGSGDVDARAAGQVACETATKTNMVMIFGEITTSAKVDYEKVVRDTCRGVGFTSDDVGLDCDKCKVLASPSPAGGDRVCPPAWPGRRDWQAALLAELLAAEGAVRLQAPLLQ